MNDSPLAVYCDASGQEAGVALKKPRKPRARRAAAVGGVEAVEQSRIPDEPPVGPVVHGAIDAPPAAADSDPSASDGPMPADVVFHRIGHLTRTLHDALRELGYDKELQGTREQLPDARDRLTYIARVTGEAAEKVLNAVDRARVVQEQMTATANDLRTRWLTVAAYAAHESSRATPAGRELIDQTCAFFAGVDSQTDVTKSILTDIMMAQDFHDLTGQVIRKVVALAQNMEEQLLKLLIETTPPEQRRKIDPEKLEGPVVKPEGRDDVVADQAGVDDLLASLGF
jgi:chemotaxis protein CheZ